jgi:enediyne biosynthesis protein E4
MRARAHLALVVFAASLSACHAPQQHGDSPHTDAAWFVDEASSTGLKFTHVNGMSGGHFMTEIIGSGVALFDYDNDGDLDVFFVQSRGASRLFRNNLMEQHALTFTDVTAESGIVTNGYGMGVATGDFDNDGFVDLYVTSFGAAQLFHNNGDGTFTDVSKRSGTDVSGWSVSATFFDYDRDGWPDLFVGNYLQYRVEDTTKCFSPSGAIDYCTPNTYRPQPSRLFHNNHDGTFTDVTARSHIGAEYGPALGVAAVDFDGDGWVDLYVANDSQPNQLWLNQHDGTFRNVALAAGVALTAEGKAEASMGVDAGDADNDGSQDLFITEQTGEGHNLYINDGKAGFEDQSARSGLASASLAYTGFGTAWFDYDNDGWLDLLTVNGAVQTIQALAQAHDPFPLHQTMQLFRNLRNRRFEDVTSRAGAVFQLSSVGRGAAFGDIDNDGDTDIVVLNNNGSARLLINDVGNKKHWLGLALVTGARVEIIRTNSPTLWRRSRADGSYASANDPRVLVGLGDSTEQPTVRVHWPDGRLSELAHVTIDRYVTVKEPR